MAAVSAFKSELGASEIESRKRVVGMAMRWMHKDLLGKYLPLEIQPDWKTIRESQLVEKSKSELTNFDLAAEMVLRGLCANENNRNIFDGCTHATTKLVKMAELIASGKVVDPDQWSDYHLKTIDELVMLGIPINSKIYKTMTDMPTYVARVVGMINPEFDHDEFVAEAKLPFSLGKQEQVDHLVAEKSLTSYTRIRGMIQKIDSPNEKVSANFEQLKATTPKIELLNYLYQIDESVEGIAHDNPDFNKALSSHLDLVERRENKLRVTESGLNDILCDTVMSMTRHVARIQREHFLYIAGHGRSN